MKAMGKHQRRRVRRRLHEMADGEQIPDELLLPGLLSVRTLPFQSFGDAGGFSSVAVDDPGEMVIDQGKMYVSPRIASTSDQDRDGEILESSGVMLARYKADPVWYWDHGHLRGEHPIGNAVNPDGEFDVHVRNGFITAGCTYSQKSPLAKQTFGMVAEHMLRARSIGFDAFKAVKRAIDQPFRLGREFSFLITSWELFEISDVGLPVNPHAVDRLKKILVDRKFQGNTLEEPIFKSLSRALPGDLLERYGVGWTPVKKPLEDGEGTQAGCGQTKSVSALPAMVPVVGTRPLPAMVPVTKKTKSLPAMVPLT